MNLVATKQSFKKFAISLPENIWDQVEEMRAVEGRSRSEIVREALRMYFHARKNTSFFGVGGLGVPMSESEER